jgi:hypothetical protein
MTTHDSGNFGGEASFDFTLFKRAVERGQWTILPKQWSLRSVPITQD